MQRFGLFRPDMRSAWDALAAAEAAFDRTRRRAGAVERFDRWGPASQRADERRGSAFAHLINVSEGRVCAGECDQCARN